MCWRGSSEARHELLLRVTHVDSLRERISLSLKKVTPEEREAWLAEQGGQQADESSESSDKKEVCRQAHIEEAMSGVSGLVKPSDSEASRYAFVEQPDKKHKNGFS